MAPQLTLWLYSVSPEVQDIKSTKICSSPCLVACGGQGEELPKEALGDIMPNALELVCICVHPAGRADQYRAT